MEILNLKQAAKFLNVSENQLWLLTRLPEKDAIPHFQRVRRGRLYFDKEKITDWWLDHHKPKPVQLKLKGLSLINR